MQFFLPLSLFTTARSFRSVVFPLLLSKLTILQYMCLYVCCLFDTGSNLYTKTKIVHPDSVCFFLSLHGSTTVTETINKVRIQQNSDRLPRPRARSRLLLTSSWIHSFRAVLPWLRLLRFFLSYKI